MKALACACVVAAGAGLSGLRAAATPQALPPPPVPPLVLDAIVLDKKGAPASDMRASDFEVLVDGKPRVGVAIARLFRGPGAAGLVAASQATMAGEMPPLAEPSRAVIFVVDQGSLLPGDDRRARLIAENCLGLVGLNDRVMFLTLPDLSGLQSLSVERDALRRGLGGVRPLRETYTSSADAQVPEAPKPGGLINRVEETIAGTPDRTATEGRGGAARPDAVAKLDDLQPSGASTGSETISPAANKAHAVTMLESLARMLDGLRTIPGSKTVLLLSAGLVADEAAPQMKAAIDAAAASFTRLYAIRMPTPAARFSDLGRVGLLNLARNTGGEVVTLTDKPAQALQRMMSELSFSYLLLLSPVPGDLDPGPRRISVRTKRKDVAIRTATIAAPGRLLPEPPAAPPALAAPPAAGSPTPPTGAGQPKTVIAAPGGAAKRPARRDPALEAVLARVSEYAENYSREFSAVVAEEVYEQKVRRATNVITVGAAQQPSSRRLVSDYLLVSVPGAQGWTPFRDVFEVDGVKVRDRDDRLKKLFLEAPPEKAAENANKIWLESARYNIGSVYRTINVPTLPFMFVAQASRPRFEFTKRGEPTESGIRAWEIDYRETTRPTIIKTRTNEDIVAEGTMWVDPVSGRILRTILKAAGATITVTYKPREDAVGLWLPVTMEENYVYPWAVIEATATYSRFRRFQVFTEEKIKPPKCP